MRKAATIILLPLGVLAAMAAVLAGSFLYQAQWKTAVVDTARSEGGVYELTLQSVGEPSWPFGSAPGRLVLQKDGETISETSFEIANDGASFSARAWSVAWYGDHVEVTLSGGEQLDELVTLYYDGQVERRRLATRYGAEVKTASDAGQGAAENAEGGEQELFPGEEQIAAGYRAIFALCSDGTAEGFAVSYGASEGSSWCVLSEDGDGVEYLVYNGTSENGACGLYVRYRGEKDAGGGWSRTDGAIVDIYAYVYESGQVVSSGKTAWADAGSAAYREAAGEA